MQDAITPQSGIMRRPEHTEDRSPVELPWSLIQGGSFLTAFQAAQHITILTLLCSAKEKLWWKHNWETGKSLYVCECICVCKSTCVRACACLRLCACARARVLLRHVYAFMCHSVSATVHVCESPRVRNNKDRTTMGNQAVSSCNFMFSNY